MQQGIQEHMGSVIDLGIMRLKLSVYICGVDIYSRSIPKELGEFVTIHESVHLLVPNHGKAFKRFMLAYLPDLEEKEQLLQGYRKAGIGEQR